MWTTVIVLRKSTWMTKAVVISFAVAALSTSYAGGLLMPAHGGPLHWRPFATRRLAKAKRERRPVLAEFTAAWCINCKVLEKTVYADRAVMRAAREARLLPLRVDLTRPHRSLEQRLVKDGGAGLPFAVMRDQDGKISERFSGIFTPSTLIQAIQLTINNAQGR